MKELHYYNLLEYVKRLEAAGLVTEYALEQAEDKEVKNLTYNSKAVTPNTLFICKGAAFKAQYLEESVGLGACAYVSEVKYDVNVPYILVRDIRKAMPILSDLYFCRPWENLNLIGITGTKGKFPYGADSFL